MQNALRFLNDSLEKRTEAGLLRKLTSKTPLIDFCSNDYLGFARSSKLGQAIEMEISKMNIPVHGSTGSRLISGNSSFIENTEAFIANFHQAESGLIFNSGYDANVGLLSSLAKRGDTIISDELIHASLIDGSRLTHAKRFRFRHNNVKDLEVKLKAGTGNIYVLVESVYSMDGDVAPLSEISSLCEKYDACLIVDEAHALGIFGDHGKGLVQELNLQDKVFARIATFGKALGSHGAIVLGSHTLRDYLLNFARSFIYTTAPPLYTIAAIKCAYQMLIEKNYVPAINEKIRLYRNLTKAAKNDYLLDSKSAIQTVQFTKNDAAKSAAVKLQQTGFDVCAILSPTVPEGKERLRICLHLFNTEEEITNLVLELNRILPNS